MEKISNIPSNINENNLDENASRNSNTINTLSVSKNSKIITTSPDPEGSSNIHGNNIRNADFANCNNNIINLNNNDITKNYKNRANNVSGCRLIRLSVNNIYPDSSSMYKLSTENE